MIRLISVMAGAAGAVMAFLGIFLKVKGTGAVSVIGGADGPTSIFIAGKVGGGSSVGMIAVGVLLVMAGILLFKWKRK